MARAAIALIALVCLAASAEAARSLKTDFAAGLRKLKQVTDSVVTSGGNPYNNPVQIYAHAREAEAWSHAKAIGIFQKHPSATVVTSGELYPAGRSQAVTQNGQSVGGRARSAGGFVAGNPVTLFGQTAIATTDMGARAFSGSNAVPMVDRTPGSLRQSSATTAMRWEVAPMRPGAVGVQAGGGSKERLAFTESAGSTDLAPLSKGISENGGGPMAHAAAGQAVAMSFADTNDNERFGGN